MRAIVTRPSRTQTLDLVDELPDGQADIQLEIDAEVRREPAPNVFCPCRGGFNERRLVGEQDRLALGIRFGDIDQQLNLALAGIRAKCVHRLQMTHDPRNVSAGLA